VPNVFRAMASQPAILRATWDPFRATVLQGLLPRTVKEMIGIVVSAEADSEYALKVHLHSLGVQGVSEDVLSTLAAGSARVPGVSPSVAAVIRLVHHAVHEGPLAVSDADVAAVTAVTAHRITPEELIEVFASIDLFRYINSFTDLARVPVDAL